jgi:GT2 family glycosyltransferase/2-polyprenyl-3-methyl-5-hydroxy-6-metoxy-1,4-benzoquinol methylase/glycosyltransferase involved in cell wall biosynthesis
MGGGLRISYLLQGTGLWGGVKIAFEQAHHLATAGHQVTILSREDLPSWFLVQVPFLKVPDFRPSNIPDSDLIIATSWPTVPFAHDAGQGIPVHLCQGYEGDFPENRSLQDRIEFAYRLHTVKLVVSPHLARIIRDRFGQDSYLIQNGVDRKIFYPGEMSTEQVLLLVGPWEVGWKGVRDGLEALRLVKKRRSGVKVVRIAQFPQTAAEKEMGIVDCYYQGLSASEMATLYRSARLLVAPSHWVEGFGLPVLEAMACGLPVIFTDIPAFRENFLSRGYPIDPVPVGRVKDMAEAILELLDSPARLSELREAGLRIAEEYDWQIVAKNLDSVVRRLYQENKGAYKIYHGRAVPGWTDPFTMVMHEQRYKLARQLVRGKTVLDAGCGVGYGANLLADEADRVIAIDTSLPALEYARSYYAAPNLEFRPGDVQNLPFPDSSVDVVTCLEVLEHVNQDQGEKMLSEFVRVLTSEGCLVISTPNKLVYSERGTEYRFHLREYNLEEFRGLLERYFIRVEVFGQGLREGRLAVGAPREEDLAFMAFCWSPRKRSIKEKGGVRDAGSVMCSANGEGFGVPQAPEAVSRGASMAITSENAEEAPEEPVNDEVSPSYYEFSRLEVQVLVPLTSRRVLDLGCAAGKLGEELKRRQPCHVTGIEICPQAAARARERLDEVICGDAMEVLPTLPAEAYDCVVLADILEHLNDPWGALREVARILVPGGVVVASIPNVRHWSVLRDLLEGRWEYASAGILDRTHRWFFTRRSIADMFDSAGFSVTAWREVRLGEQEVPPALITSLSNLGLEVHSLAEEGRVYQYLVVAQKAPVSARKQLPATAEGRSYDQKQLVSIVMPVYNLPGVTEKCLRAIIKYANGPYELIIVDNGSDEVTGQVIDNIASTQQNVIVIRNGENLGYPLACNQGLARASGEYIVIMNSDVFVTPYWDKRIMAAFQGDLSIGIVGPRTNYCAGVQIVTECSYDENSLDSWAEQWYLRRAGALRPANRLIGFLWMMKREVIEKIGGFDPLFGIGNYEDDDYCIRAQLAGYKLVIADDVFVHHYGSQSFKKKPDTYMKLLETNKLLFVGKWEVDFILNFNTQSQ